MRQIVRDRTWGATLSLLTSLMLLVQLLMVFLLGVQGVNALLRSRAAIQLEVLDSAAEQDIQEFYASLRSQSFADAVSYVPREKALELQKAANPDLVAFLEEYGLDNPFPDTFSVTLADVGSYDAFVAFVQQERWRPVVNPAFLTSVTRQEGEVRSLLRVTGAIRMLTAVFLCIALAALCFVVLEWVSRSLLRRSDEVMLQHLLGGTPRDIVLPFIVEMTILLSFALAVATLIVLLVLSLLPFLMPSLALEPSFRQVHQQLTPLLWTVLPMLVALELVLLPVLAFGGMVLGTRRQLPWTQWMGSMGV